MANLNRVLNMSVIQLEMITLRRRISLEFYGAKLSFHLLYISYSRVLMDKPTPTMRQKGPFSEPHNLALMSK